jgi:hypothetical protein
VGKIAKIPAAESNEELLTAGKMRALPRSKLLDVF